MKLLKFTILFQVIYFFITALWPLFHIHSFMLVTGYKQDIWLVKCVSVLILAIAVSLGAAYIKKEYNFSIFILAITSCAGLAAIDIYYALNNVINDIYLADAAVEVILILLWLKAFSSAGTQKGIIPKEKF